MLELCVDNMTLDLENDRSGTIGILLSSTIIPDYPMQITNRLSIISLALYFVHKAPIQGGQAGFWILEKDLDFIGIRDLKDQRISDQREEEESRGSGVA